MHLVAEPVAGTELQSRENCGMYSALNLFIITPECPHSVPVRKIRSQPCPQTRKCSLNHHVPPTLTSVSPRSNPTHGTRAWVCLPLRGGIHGQSITLSTCQLHPSPSSNQLHRCCARCCTSRGCTCQRRQPASATRTESRWRDDSSTILVDEPARQRCAAHAAAVEPAAASPWPAEAIKRRV